MNRHAQEVLEFQQLLQLIADYCQSPCGQNEIKALVPSQDSRKFQVRRNLNADFMRLQEMPFSMPGLFVEDVSEILIRVAPASCCLSGPELVQCRSQLSVVGEVLDFLDNQEFEHLSELMRIRAGLDACRDLQNSLLRSLDFDGTVLDGASERLRQIRRDLASIERRIQRTLEDMVHDTAMDGVLQDSFVTMRNGRYVVPVRRDAKNQVNGLVHDLSNSGQTLFVEPSVTLGLGNDLSVLKVEERDEVRRILVSLSSRVREKISSFRRNQELLGKMDAAHAVSRWAADYSCCLPAFGGFLELKQARHPLLLAQFRREGKGRKVVPLDFSMPRGSKALVITGSNTGGKTVILKTIGLLVLAAQCGLPVPVGEGSLFAVYDDVLADIGDEQSMEANLSTFSAHVANISSILKDCRYSRCMVLLDELGSGTDPLEGGSLACGILESLAKSDTLTLATTHLGMVKNYVHSQKNMINAAVRFNKETFQPEYILDIGRPGASHALQIARRMGMPAEVMKTAEGMMSGEHLRLEDVLVEMENQQHRLAKMSEEAEKARNESIREREELQRQMRELKQHKKERLNEAYAEAESIVLNARKEVEGLMRSIRENAPAQKAGVPASTAKADEAVKKAREVIGQRLGEFGRGQERTAVKPSGKPLQTTELRVGQKIWVEKLGAHGRIERFSDNANQVEVNVNGVTFSMKLKDLARCPQDTAKDEDKPVVKVQIARFMGDTSHELNLVGYRVEEALLQLEPYIHECLLAHLDEVRIIHGYGTGRLRQGIHEWLRRQPYIKGYWLGKDFVDPGGAGATIVKLR